MHHPKGEMCMACKHLLEDCSGLAFEDMRVIEKYESNGEQFMEVKCVGFQRKET